MEQLIAHLFGDYVLQNHWMANEKVKRWWPAVVHVLLYGVPFLFLVHRWEQWAVIVGTHYLIDRFRLARFWVEFWGVGYWPTEFFGSRGAISILRDPTVPDHVILPRGSQSPPPFLAVWLLILVDNTFHLLINYAALRWL